MATPMVMMMMMVVMVMVMMMMMVGDLLHSPPQLMASPPDSLAHDVPPEEHVATTFSTQLETAIHDLLPSRDPFDRADFNPVDFVNAAFPSEQKLALMEPFAQRLRLKIRNLDEEILKAVRQQSTSGHQAKEDLSRAKRAIHELFSKIRDIKRKAEQSEMMVQEICRDIKSLDYAKRHLTATITALKRLSMLVTAVDQLDQMAAKRQYHDAASLLGAVNQLALHFDAYRDIPKISQLKQRIGTINTILKEQVFRDFDDLRDRGLENPNPRLRDACLVIDSLGPESVGQLIAFFCNGQMMIYRRVFASDLEESSLAKTERRYTWLKRVLRHYDDEYRKIFPSTWEVPRVLCQEFCRVTNEHLTHALQVTPSSQMDVKVLMHVVQKTIDFEQELTSRFAAAARLGDGELVMSSDEEDEAGVSLDGLDLTSAEGIKRKYTLLKRQQEREQRRKERESRRAEADAAEEQRAGKPQPPRGIPKFSGLISSCFEPYMGSYVTLEESNMAEFIDRIVKDEKWISDDNRTRVLGSSAELFLYIKRSLKRCATLTRNQTLFDLFKVFTRMLKAYADILMNRLPKLPTTASSQDWQVKVTENDEAIICMIINTCEYCFETSKQLAEQVKKMIEPAFVEHISVENEQDDFSNVIMQAIKILIRHVESTMESSLLSMVRMPWGTWDAVGDQSNYVMDIINICHTTIPRIRRSLSASYFSFFCDKRISEMGAQQMLLDTQSIKKLLLEMPGIGEKTPTPAPSTYTKFVQTEMSKAEMLLKVIQSPADTLVECYQSFIPEGSAADLQKIMELKGLKKGEQQGMLESWKASFQRGGKTFQRLFSMNRS